MYFTITNVGQNNIVILQAKRRARRLIVSCKRTATEAALNIYLNQTFKTTLTAACLKIINKAQYSFNNQGDLVITILDKNLDKLASIITFGTGKVQGSNILKLAFGQY